MIRRKLRDTGMKGVSSIVAAVILLAVSIVVAASLAYWAGGLTGLYTESEKVEITSAYSMSWTNGTSGWTITLNLKNSGSADASIDSMFINGKPPSEYASSLNVTVLPLHIASGQTAMFSFEIRRGSDFSAGTIIDIKLHSAIGHMYPRLLMLD